MAARSGRKRNLPKWMLSLVSSDTQTLIKDCGKNQVDASENLVCCDADSSDDDKEEPSKIIQANTVMYMMSERELLHVARERLHQEKEDFPSDETIVTKPTKICFSNKTVVNFESTSSRRQLNSDTVDDTDFGNNGNNGSNVNNRRTVVSRHKINKNLNMNINKKSRKSSDFNKKETNECEKSKTSKIKPSQTLVNVNQFSKDSEAVSNVSMGHSCERLTKVSPKMSTNLDSVTNLDSNTDRMATNTSVNINNRQRTNKNIPKDESDSILPFTTLKSKQMTREKPDLSILDEIFS